jgi:Amt family ammonium transporter
MSVPSSSGASSPSSPAERTLKPWWPIVAIGLLLILGILFSLPGSFEPPAVGGGPINAADTAWILTATALVLLMTPGLAFFYGGMVGRQHIVSTMFLSFIAIGVVSLLWIVVGFSLAFGDSIGGLIGDPRTFFMLSNVSLTTHPTLSPTVPFLLFALFQMKFAIITPALVTGAFVERIRFGAFIVFMLLFSIFVYAPLAHWTWHPHGILRVWGILDFAGGTVVHMSAGFAGLAGALVVARKRVNPDDLDAHAPANIPFILLGTGLLWFGWFGFNAGSALAANEQAVLAFMTTNTAAAAAMVAWVLFDLASGRRPSAMGAAIGAVVGLVAITPASGFVGVGASIVIGTLSSLASNLILTFGIKSVLDDTLDVFACHGVGGVVGMILTAVFAKEGGLITGDATLLWKHLIAAIGVAAFSFTLSVALYRIVGFVMHLHHRDYHPAIPETGDFKPITGMTQKP